MTREEAIDIIKCLAWHTRPNEEDIEQAIKALEQEPCEGCISRVALSKALYEHFHDENSPINITLVALGSIRSFVRDFPPATHTCNLGKIRSEVMDCLNELDETENEIEKSGV